MQGFDNVKDMVKQEKEYTGEVGNRSDLKKSAKEFGLLQYRGIQNKAYLF